MSRLETEPVPVHVASVADGLGPAPRRRLRAVSLYTVVLTADEPAKQVLQPDPNRVIARVQAGGNNVVLARTKGDAQAAANTGDVTLARPNGMLLPYANATPYPLETTGEVWAAAAAYPAQVAVSVITEAGS